MHPPGLNTVRTLSNTVFLVVTLLMVGLLAACDSTPAGVEPVDVTVSVTFSDGYDPAAAAGAEVTLTDVTAQQTYEGQLNAEGQTTFNDLPAGTYDIAVILTLTRDEAFALTGTYPDEAEVVFNGAASNVQINQDTPPPTIELTAGQLGDLVIKQVYYAGSDIIDGAIFRDQFIEIYNNANTEIDVDGLYIMGAYGVNRAGETDYVTEDGQFDWSQSIGMPADINANTDYLYAKYIYQIPDDGTPTILQPGESVVIAQTALNHKQPYTDTEGEPVSVNDPSLTVDLSGADFEVYLGDDIETPLASDIDNPDVPNMRNIFIFGKDMILDPLGRDAYVLFRTDTDPSEFEAYPDPQTRSITDGTTLYPQIPIEWVVDAVETQPSPANQIPRKLPDVLDAGYTYVPGGSYSSNSAIRILSKPATNADVLRDTNNSTEDFGVLETADPRGAAPATTNKAGRAWPPSGSPAEGISLDRFTSRWAPGVRR